MDLETRYQQALDYLYSYVDFSLQRNFHLSPELFDLGRMRELMTRLGEPQDAYPTLHIAGTKGKGSVSALCASALKAAGYKTGLYTSPHLQEYTERIQINGQEISKAELVDLVDLIQPHVDAIPHLTTFEITTALAFWHFARQGVQAAVIEVGLGGRLDSTNIILPKACVITSLSYDHAEILGSTLAEIAGEKAGIIKPGVPAVLSPQTDEARLVVERIAAERGASLVQVGRDWLYAPVEHSLDGQTFAVWHRTEQEAASRYIESGGLEEWEPNRLSIPLLGSHQVENAAAAYAALIELGKAGIPITDAHIRQGFATVQWPGRFEILSRSPLLVVDSAHNRYSALKLRLALDEYFPGLPFVLVFGASGDKDIQGMFAELMPRVDQVIVTRSIHPRAADLQQLVKLAGDFGKSAQAYDTVEAALDEALRLAGSRAAVLVTGSIFVAAGARLAWFTRHAALTEL